MLQQALKQLDGVGLSTMKTTRGRHALITVGFVLVVAHFLVSKIEAAECPERRELAHLSPSLGEAFLRTCQLSNELILAVREGATKMFWLHEAIRTSELNENVRVLSKCYQNAMCAVTLKELKDPRTKGVDSWLETFYGVQESHDFSTSRRCQSGRGHSLMCPGELKEHFKKMGASYFYRDVLSHRKFAEEVLRLVGQKIPEGIEPFSKEWFRQLHVLWLKGLESLIADPETSTEYRKILVKQQREVRKGAEILTDFSGTLPGDPQLAPGGVPSTVINAE